MCLIRDVMDRIRDRKVRLLLGLARFLIMTTYHIAPIAPPASFPPGFELEGEDFNPQAHLQLELPSHVKNLTFKDFLIDDYIATDVSCRCGQLAYTRPFRVLSDEGIAAARRSIAANKHLSKSNERASNYVRGLGYASKFHRSFAYSSDVLALLSKIAGDDLSPHSMAMNISHLNIGEVNTGKPVDKWHIDSVDYVLVLIISDTSDMEGGDLQVLQLRDATGSTFKQLQANGIPSDLVETVKYTGPGYGIFMQGSKILHTVTEVLKGREPRVSLVNSFMSTNPFAEDKTRLATFLRGGFDDGDEIASLEFARHKAWRISGQMQYLLNEVHFGTDTQRISRYLLDAAAELERAAKLISGELNDNAMWVETEKA